MSRFRRDLGGASREERGAHRVLLGGLAALPVAVGLALRLVDLRGWWVNPDEGIYFSWATWESSTRFWQSILQDVHPPLYYLILRGMSALSENFLWLRSLSLLCGTLAIPAAWFAGRELGGAGTVGVVTGGIAATLVALSPGAIAMSQVIRPYMFQLLFLLLATFFLLRARRRERAADLVGYAVCLSIALLTHYSSFLALGAFGLLLPFDLVRRDRPRLERLLLANVLPALVVAALWTFHLRPHLLGSEHAANALRTWLTPYLIRSVGDVWPGLAGFFAFLLGSRFAVAGVVVAVVGLLLAARRRWTPPLIPFFTAFGLAILGSALGRVPFGCTRHSSWLIGFAALLLAWTLASMFVGRRRPWIAAGFLAGLTALGPTLASISLSPGRRLVPVPEHVVRESDVRSLAPVFSNMDRPGVVILSSQSYHLLLPLVADQRPSIEEHQEHSFFRFRWGSRDALVLKLWEFSFPPENAGEDNHFSTFLHNVDHALPGLALRQQRDAVVILGGWPNNTQKIFLTMGSRPGPEYDFVTPLAQAPGLLALGLDIPRFEVWYETVLERHREGRPGAPARRESPPRGVPTPEPLRPDR